MIMHLPRKSLLAFLALALTSVACIFPAQPSSAQAAVTTAESEWRQDLDAWRTRRAQEIGSPAGPLTLIGLEWLKSGANSIGAAPDNQIQLHAEVPGHIGLFTVSGKSVQLLAIGDGFPMDLTIDGQSAREGPLVVDGPKPSVIGWRGLSMVVLNRGGRFALRINDSDSPARTGFHGLSWFPVDSELSVEAAWTPFDPPHTEAIPTGIGTTLDLPSPGQAEFTLGDQKLVLEPVLENPNSQTLFFILSDATGKDSTFAGGRYLHASFPSNGLDKPGKLILDFNRLENPACAYTSNAGCPQPPQRNRLPVSIEAGEKRYTP